MPSCFGVPGSSLSSDGESTGSSGDYYEERSRGKRPKLQALGSAFTSESVLAEEMNKLSFKEREQIYEELHGVADPGFLKIETPVFIAGKIQEMQEAVKRQPQRKRRDYDRAMFLNPSLKNDQTFFLLFLRADHYDARLAAKRICSHFTDKVELWGEDCIARRITLEDLDEEDMHSLRRGAFRFLESKDRSGRLVIFFRADSMRYETWRSHVRLPGVLAWLELLSPAHVSFLTCLFDALAPDALVPDDVEILG